MCASFVRPVNYKNIAGVYIRSGHATNVIRVYGTKAKVRARLAFKFQVHVICQCKMLSHVKGTVYSVRGWVNHIDK